MLLLLNKMQVEIRRFLFKNMCNNLFVENKMPPLLALFPVEEQGAEPLFI